MAKPKRKPQSPVIKNDDEVTLKSNPQLHGKVISVDQDADRCVVNFGGVDQIILSQHELVVDPEVRSSTPVHQSQPGFNQYPIEWYNVKGNILKFASPEKHDPMSAVKFRTKLEGIEFSGFINKAAVGDDGEMMWQVFTFARAGDQPYTLPPIAYSTDPRERRSDLELDEKGSEAITQYSGIREINADVCSMINRWVHFHLKGNATTIQDLELRASHPAIHFSDFTQLRNMIVTLHEAYEKAAHSGGYRVATLKGQQKNDPDVLVVIDCTSQLIRMMQDRSKYTSPPNLPGVPGDVETAEPSTEDEASPRAVKSNGRRGVRTGVPEPTGTNEQLLKIKQEIESKEKRDRTEDEVATCRKIRAVFRRRGFDYRKK